MIDRIEYGQWSLSYCELRATHTVDEARVMDETGERYWVMFGPPERPEFVIDVAPERVHISVKWLDEHLRPVLSYLFVPEDKTRPLDRSQRLFLEQVHWDEYDHPDDPLALAARGGTSFFDPDGSAYNVRDIGNGREVMESPAMDPAEAERVLFEPHPAFGQWDSIIRRDRDLPR